MDGEEVLAVRDADTVKLMGAPGILDSSENILDSRHPGLAYQWETTSYRARNALDEFSDLF
ncbi:MAG: hypothetical protein ABEJ07_03025 [Candidatus Nanohaloarchaea archaeon]